MRTISPGVSLTTEDRVRLAVEAARDISRQIDPNEMIHTFRQRMGTVTNADRFVAVSRRDLADGRYRITRSSTWDENVNPWRQRDQLPLLEGGLVGELLYGDEPRIIDDLQAVLDPDDPMHPYLAGAGSLMAIHHYDQGVGLNLALLLKDAPAGFDHDRFHEQILLSNIFGRATNALVLANALEVSNRELERELKVVGEIQRTLLPQVLPEVDGLDMAAGYETARRASGDYYDIFELEGGRYGFLIADVAGHGTPAAVIMSITHAVAHAYAGPNTPPCGLLDYINNRLSRGYTKDTGTFVTAFYGVYDPASRKFHYARAGHDPPRLRRGDDLIVLTEPAGLPLGIIEETTYEHGKVTLEPGDVLVMYTDGIVEAFGPDHELFGVERLNKLICANKGSAADLVATIETAVDDFSEGAPPSDDRTLFVLRAV